MRAVQFDRHGGPEVLACRELPVPAPGPGEVRVKVEAVGVNYADTVRRWGDHYPVPTSLPHVAGGELVGIVDSVGEGVPGEWLGRRVFGAPDAGAYAEYACVPFTRIFPFPQNLDPSVGVALFIQGLSAALILKRCGRLAPGEDVFIEGAAGGVGLLALQLARRYGAGRIFAGASSEEKRALVRTRGADRALDYSRGGWSAEIMEATGGRGVDVVLEMTGGAVFREAFACLAPEARVVVYGIASREPFPIPSERLISRGITVTGFYLGLYLHRRDVVTALLDELAGFVRRGEIVVDIGGVFPLEQAAEAHRRLEARRASGKLVLVP
jgi:NADPH2:quinone reductase